MNKISTFAERLNELIALKGITKSQLAKLCDIDKSNITRYCNGKYEAKQDVVYTIASRLGIQVPWLMGYDVPMDVAITVDSSNMENILSAYHVPSQEDLALQKQHEEINALFDSLPPDLRTLALNHVKDIARLVKSQGTRGESD